MYRGILSAIWHGGQGKRGGEIRRRGDLVRIDMEACVWGGGSGHQPPPLLAAALTGSTGMLGGTRQEPKCDLQ